MRTVKKLGILFCIFFVLGSNVFGENSAFTTSDMRDVEKKAEELRAKYKGAENVLIVFDIDNTLLTMEKELGSEEWFDWQEKILNDEAQKAHRVGDNFQALLFATGLIFENGSMKCAEGEITKTVFHNLQKSRHKILLLTSRDYSYMFDTFHELYENGLVSEKSAITMQNDADVWLPYDVHTVQKEYGFTDTEYVEFKLNKEPFHVRYTRGIFFTAGQHKGAMMRIIMKKVNANPHAIIFVDNKEKQTARMHNAFKNSSIELVTYRYSVLDTKEEKFHSSDKKGVISEWNNLMKKHNWNRVAKQ